MALRKALLMALLCLCLASTSAWAQAKHNLFDARRKGWITFEAVAMHGFRKIEIEVTNLTGRTLRLDPAGSVLTPPDPALQRLGLAGVVGGVPGEDSALIIVLPKKKWTGLIHAVCLDFGKGTPPNGVPYKLALARADEKAYRVLRYWADHPHLKQDTVNDVIWTGQTLETLKSQVLPPWLVGSDLLAHGNRVYWRTGGRSLFQASADGASWVKVGENLDTVALGGGQVAGYIHLIPGLRWYNLSQRRWEYFFLPRAPHKVLLAPDRSMFVLAAHTLYAYRPGQKEFTRFSSRRFMDADLGSAAVNPILCAVESPAGTVVLYDREKKAWTALPGKGATSVRATERSVYATLPLGVHRLRGRRWRKVADRGWTVTPGRRKAFFSQKNRLVVYDEGKDALVTRTTLPQGTLSWSVDRATDRCLALDERTRLLVLEGDGTWRPWGTLPTLPSSPR